MTITIRAVHDKQGRSDFLQVADTVYRGDPHYIAPLRLERQEHLSAKNPYFAHAQAAFFVAYDAENKPVGRISAQLDALAQREGQSRCGHFGMLEAVDEPVLRQLLARAEDWLCAQGAQRVEGPYSLSINDECGLLIEGFDSAARMLMNYAKPWYGAALEACGYAKAKDLLAFRMEVAKPLPAPARSMAQKALNDQSLRERPLNPKRFDADLQAILAVFNDAWAGNWGFVPMTEAEIAHTAKSLRPLIQPQLARIIEKDGEPLAMLVALPDLNEALRGLHGRLLPFGWLRLLWRLKVAPPKAARVLLMGVRQAYQSGFVGAAMAAALIAQTRDALHAAGYAEAELSWILEDNLPMLRLIESVGGKAYKRYRLYEKELQCKA